jgi:hypothetical protein
MLTSSVLQASVAGDIHILVIAGSTSSNNYDLGREYGSRLSVTFSDAPPVLVAKYLQEICMVLLEDDVQSTASGLAVCLVAL